MYSTMLLLLLLLQDDRERAAEAGPKLGHLLLDLAAKVGFETSLLRSTSMAVFLVIYNCNVIQQSSTLGDEAGC
jgi:hypothetical protein